MRKVRSSGFNELKKHYLIVTKGNAFFIARRNLSNVEGRNATINLFCCYVDHPASDLIVISLCPLEVELQLKLEILSMNSPPFKGGNSRYNDYNKKEIE